MIKTSEKNIFIITFLMFSLCFSNFAFAEDPCDEIPGTWQGPMEYGECIWDSKVTGTKYKDMIRLQAVFKKRSGYNCKQEGSYVFTGTCHDSHINVTLDNKHVFKGSVFSNFIYLQSDYGATMQLQKK